MAKMQNLSQNELNQIVTMHNQFRDELERVAKMRRIKNRKRMSKEEIIIALLKSKLAQLNFLTITLMAATKQFQKNPQQIKRYTTQKNQKKKIKKDL